MKSKELKKVVSNASTQEYLDIAEIREDVVVMKDGTIRGVLLASSINFALKSEDEQTAVISNYISFINGLDFPIQILIQSRPLNIDNYISQLEILEKQQSNELLRKQTADYREYIKEFLEIGDIMSKKFYVVVPYIPGAHGKKSFFDRLNELFWVGGAVRIRREQFEKSKQEIEKRIRVVQGGLNGFGVGSGRLNTQNLIELYYSSYNPDVAGVQKLENIQDYSVSPETIIQSE
jgi:hypothetical protein